MNQDQNIQRFREIETELFRRVAGGFTAFKTEQGAIGIGWKHDGPLLETLGIMALLEEQIDRYLAKSKTEGTEFIDPEELLFDPFDLNEPDLTLSTMPALRDALRSIFPSVVVGYFLPKKMSNEPDMNIAWVGKPLDCLGLLRWAGYRLRVMNESIFGQAEDSLDEYTISELEVRSRLSGQIMILSPPDLLQAAGYADLVRGKTSEHIMQRGEGDGSVQAK